jgi:hypothetical protein
VIDDAREQLPDVPHDVLADRSNTTIVAWTEKPIVVSVPVINIASSSKLVNRPSSEKIPSNATASWTSATSAHVPYRIDRGTRRNAHQRYPRMPRQAAAAPRSS